MRDGRGTARLRRALAAALGALLATGLAARASAADDALPDGDEIVRRVNARDDGQQMSSELTMELVGRGGDVRTRETRSYRKDFDGERRSVLFYDQPKNLKDTAFLTRDYPEPGRDDDQWLYLPALRKTRRISGADRGGAFLGTDFSYEDIKKGTRIGVEDYTRKTLRAEAVDGQPCWLVEHVPVSERVARELGYGRVLTWVDAELWLVRRAEYFDERGEPLKSVRIFEIEAVDGIWTPQLMEAESRKSGHRTVLRFRNVDYGTELPDDLFSEAGLARGR